MCVRAQQWRPLGDSCAMSAAGACHVVIARQGWAFGTVAQLQTPALQTDAYTNAGKSAALAPTPLLLLSIDPLVAAGTLLLE